MMNEEKHASYHSAFRIQRSSLQFVSLLQTLHDQLRVDAARALDEYEVARAYELGERFGRLLRRVEEARRAALHPGLARALYQFARKPTHPPEHVNSVARDVAPRLSVERGAF